MVEPKAPAAVAEAPKPSRATTWDRFRSSRITLFWSAVLISFIAVAILAPLLVPYDPGLVSRAILRPPSMVHPFGTDNLGKDVLSGVLMGARSSLLIGFSVGALVLVLGVLIGSTAGFMGGRVDAWLMQVAAFFQIMPSFILALVAAAIIGRSTALVIIVLSITQWSDLARIVRAQYLRLKNSLFVEAARASGLTSRHIAFREILPNAISPVIVAATLNVGSAILLESGLSFLGLGDANNPSWGEMLNRAQPYLARAWWMSVFPGAAIFFVVVAINLVGDALNDALDPKGQGLTKTKRRAWRMKSLGSATQGGD